MPLTSSYSDNAAHYAPITTTGFKISKPGYDATNTPGSNYVFNSSWPSLPIGFEQKMANPITGNSKTLTLAHGLQYPPFCMGWAYAPDPGGIGYVGTRFIPMSDKTNIYLSGASNSTPPYNATYIILRAFALDISTDIDYVLASGSTYNQPYDNNFGIKFVKTGKDINSRDMRDFVIHSRCQSPLILAVKTEATMSPNNTAVIQYTSNLKYPVWVYGFIKAGSNSASNLGVPVGTYVPAPYYSQAYPRTFTDGFKSYIGWNTGSSADNGASLVILRDPMFAANPVTVQF